MLGNNKSAVECKQENFSKQRNRPTVDQTAGFRDADIDKLIPYMSGYV